MKKLHKLLAIAGCVTLSCAIDASVTYAQSFNNAGLATVVKPITITQDKALDFGKFIPGAGTVTMTSEGVKTSTGVTIPAQWTATGNAGNYLLDGEKDATYSVAVETPATLTGDAGGTMEVALSTPSPTGTLDTSGVGAVKVGGVLTVGASQTPGNYSGSFNLSVSYN